MLTITYKYKLKLSKEQIQVFDDTLEVCRQIWNFALKERKDWSMSRKSPIDRCSLFAEYIIPADAPYPNYYIQAKNLTQARKTNSNLGKIHSQVGQQVLKKLEESFVQMKSLGKGYPRFKRQGQLKSFVFPQLGKNPLADGKIKLPQVGWVKLRQSRPYPESFVAKQARILKKPSGYFVLISFQLDVDVPAPFPHDRGIGVDINLSNFLTTSDQKIVARPKFFDTLKRKLKLLQRRLKNKKKFSNNWWKLQKKIARVHEQIADARRDFHFKVAHWLCDQAKMIFCEELNFKAWAKGMLRKHTLDAGFGQFFEILKWVCWKRDVYFAKVDPNYTSQECPKCHHIKKKQLSERTHHCESCGYQTLRDHASAEVILQRGLNAVGRTVSENACGLDATGARAALAPSSSSWQGLKQESPTCPT
jgi:putative transposase